MDVPAPAGKELTSVVPMKKVEEDREPVTEEPERELPPEVSTDEGKAGTDSP